MKKALALIAVCALAISMAACGKAPSSTSASATPSSTPASTSTSTPASSTASSTSTPADEEQTYTLDYDAILEWLDGGFLGKTDDGALALLGVNKDTTLAIAVFADDATMEAISFVGEFIENSDGTVTINDTESELALTFGFEQDGETTYKMDLGEEMGSAILSPATIDDLKAQLKTAIDNYKHIA